MRVPSSPVPALAAGTALAIALALATATVPVGAASTSSVSISDSVATSIGSLSTSVKKSSDSSSGDDKVAEGDYRVTEVAELAPQADQPALTRLTLRAVQGPDEFYLMLPPVVAAQHALAPGVVVSARHKPYGLAFAKAETRDMSKTDFFLVLEDHWRRELPARAVTL